MHLPHNNIKNIYENIKMYSMHGGLSGAEEPLWNPTDVLSL